MRVALVGAGFMGGVHLNAYAGIPEVEVVGVADARIESAVAGAEVAGARSYASYQELVAAEDVEVVDVCLPTAFHRDLAVSAAGEGRHVILEKPIARTMEDAQEIVKAFSGDGPSLFVGHVVRFFPEYVGIKQKIDAGDLGMIGVVRTSRRSPFLLGWNDWYADWRVSGGVLLDQASENSGSMLRTAFPVRYLPSVARAREIVCGGALGRVLAVSGTNRGKIPGGWFLDPELAGGGAVMDHTVHLADLLRWMLDVEVKSVYAEVDAFFGAGGTDDAAILTLELEGGSFADGAFATIDPSWSRGDGYPTWGGVTLRIAGTSGVLDVDPFAQPLRIFDHETGVPSWSYTGEDMNSLMLKDFLRGVAEGEPSGASGLDGLRTLEVVLAAYSSGENHEPKNVERTP
jgi:predicted dehydrogenase